jgi:hypothetical protein
MRVCARFIVGAWAFYRGRAWGSFPVGVRVFPGACAGYFLRAIGKLLEKLVALYARVKNFHACGVLSPRVRGFYPARHGVLSPRDRETFWNLVVALCGCMRVLSCVCARFLPACVGVLSGASVGFFPGARVRLSRIPTRRDTPVFTRFLESRFDVILCFTIGSWRRREWFTGHERKSHVHESTTRRGTYHATRHA